MTIRRRTGIALTLFLLTIAGLAYAHHGTEAYDMGKKITLKGVIAQFEWSNPHGQVHLDVTDEKETSSTITLKHSRPASSSMPAGTTIPSSRANEVTRNVPSGQERRSGRNNHVDHTAQRRSTHAQRKVREEPCETTFHIFSIAVATALSLSTGLFAQAGSPTGGATGAKDLQGVWLFGGGADTFNLPRNAPFQPWAKTKFDLRKEPARPHVVIDYASNTDPFIKACDPLGVPRVLLANHPFKVVQTPSEMILL